MTWDKAADLIESSDEASMAQRGTEYSIHPCVF